VKKLLKYWMKPKIAFWLSLFYLGISSAQVQVQDSVFVNDSLKTVKRKRTNSLLAVSVFGVGTHAILYSTWYSKADQSKFHFFNDNKQWLQMDKAGHAWSSFILSEATSTFYENNGYNSKQAANLGLASSLVFQTAIEYFDGRSSRWGASTGDLGANVFGSMWSWSQRRIWGKVKIPIKFSVSLSNLASKRPNVLGANLPQRLLKDYNAQTYWLNFQPNLFDFKVKGPKWLGFSLGYGAQGMVGGLNNIFQDQQGVTQDLSHIQRYRQFYISPSVSLSHLHSKHKVINVLYKLTDYIRLPLPSLEMTNKGNMQWNWIHY